MQGLVPELARAQGQDAAAVRTLRAAQARIAAATGSTFPTVPARGEANASAGRLLNRVGTGLPLRVIPGAYAHELTHQENGDPRRSMGPLQTPRAERAADYGAGRKLVAAGYLGTGAVAAYLRFVAQSRVGEQHGPGAWRVRATLAGVRDALAGR